MTRLIHVLGADIPHHNQTILRFFNDILAEENQDARQFMVVSREDTLGHAFPHLTIQRFGSKRELALTLIAKALADRRQRFFLHGQFNLLLWLGMLIGGILPRQICWHIWGADLYEASDRLRFRLFYRIRRLAQKRVAHVFATRGDLHYFHQMHPTRPGSVLYFPTRMAPVGENQVAQRPSRDTLSILLGNSGDRSNRHIAALQEIHRQFGQRVKVVIPMGYPANNASYIHEVHQTAQALFSPENIEILTENIPFNAYMTLLAQCDLGYFIFERQQGIGTLCLLIQAGIPCVLSRKNPFCLDMAAEQIPVLYQDQPLDVSAIREAQEVLRQLDLRQVAFFNPGYVQGWHQALAIAAGDTR